MAERQFGPYRLIRQIAVGGMAEIHLAKTAGIAGFEKYVALQNDKSTGWKVRHKYADPWDMPAGMELRGFSYFSSFGCPEPCTFCCSPMSFDRSKTSSHNTISP